MSQAIRTLSSRLRCGAAAGVLLLAAAPGIGAASAGAAELQDASNPGQPGAAPSPAAAVQGGQGVAVVSEEIVVTAQRRAEGLQQVPISINAFNQDSLERLNIRSTDQLQFATPGFINTQTSGDGISGVYIRGVGTGYSGPGLEGSIAFYSDDIYFQSQTAAVQNAVDVSQVQVLKGPQGTLYGRNATGGAVVVTTAEPRLGVLEGYVKGGLGDLDWMRAEGVVNIPLGPTLAARFAGFYEERDGYVKNIAFPSEKKGGVGAGETYSLRGKLRWEPSEAFNATATVAYDRRDGNGAIHSLRYTGAGVPTGLGWYETTQSPMREGGGNDDFSALLGALRTEYTSGVWTLSNTLAWRRARSYGCTDNDGVPDELLYFCLVSQRSPRAGNAHGKEDATLTDELRLVSDSDGPLNVTAGLFYERNRARFVGRIGGGFFGSLLPTFDNRDDLTAYSGYVELYYNLTEHLKVTGGLRYTHETKKHRVILDQDGIDFLTSPGFTPSVYAEAKKDFSNVSPRLVISYQPGTINYYASFNRGFKSGGFNSPAFTIDPPLSPEKISAFEVGAKYRSPDGRLRIGAAAFYYDWKDVQVAFITGGGAGIQQQNAAAAEVKGGEVNLDWTPDRNWAFSAGLAYTHGRFTKFPGAAVYNLINGGLTATAEDLKGEPLPNAPDLTANASVTYNFDLTGGWSGAVTLAGRYTTEYDFTAGAGGQLRAARQPAFGLVNLSGSFFSPDERIELGWFVSNLLDEEYISLISTGNTGVYQSPAEPRLFGATITYKF